MEYRSQEPEVRIAEADFFQEAVEDRRVAITEIFGEYQVVAAFFYRALGQIHETGLIGLPAPTKSLRDIRRDGDGGAPHRYRQPVGFRFWKIDNYFFGLRP